MKNSWNVENSRDYYIQRQGYIIEHLREMFDKGAEI